MISDHLIYAEASLFGLGKLVGEGLICGGDTSIKDGRHDIPTVRKDGVR